MVPFHISLFFKVNKVTGNKKDEKAPAKLNIEFLHPLLKETASHVEFHLDSGAATTYVQKLSVTMSKEEINGAYDKIKSMMDTWKSRKLGVQPKNNFYDKQEVSRNEKAPTIKNVKSWPKANSKKKNLVGVLKAHDDAVE